MAGRGGETRGELGEVRGGRGANQDKKCQPRVRVAGEADGEWAGCAAIKPGRRRASGPWSSMGNEPGATLPAAAAGGGQAFKRARRALARIRRLGGTREKAAMRCTGCLVPDSTGHQGQQEPGERRSIQRGAAGGAPASRARRRLKPLFRPLFRPRRREGSSRGSCCSPRCEGRSRGARGGAGPDWTKTAVGEISRRRPRCRRWRRSAAAFEVEQRYIPKLAYRDRPSGIGRPATTSRRVRGPLPRPCDGRGGRGSRP